MHSRAPGNCSVLRAHYPPMLCVMHPFIQCEWMVCVCLRYLGALICCHFAYHKMWA